MPLNVTGYAVPVTFNAHLFSEWGSVSTADLLVHVWLGLGCFEIEKRVSDARSKSEGTIEYLIDLSVSNRPQNAFVNLELE